ncbi:MAG: rod shape-determining protein MreC [Candidatus Brocadiia bacterium]
MALHLRPTTRNRLLAAALLAACILSVASPGPWQHALRGRARRVARPPLRLFAASHDGLRLALDRLAALWSNADRLRRLEDENRALREALARQADELRHAQARLRDFSRFEDFLSTSLMRPLRILPANVLAADASPWRHTLVIDRGSRDGVRVGDPALWGHSIVGTVVARRPAAATVRLITDSRAGLKVRVARTGDVGLLRGVSEPHGLLRLKWVSLHPVEKDDLIVSSGQNPAIPPGLLAGQVASASPTRTPHFYEVRVRPLLDFARLTELLVVVYQTDDAQELLEDDAAEAPD